MSAEYFCNGYNGVVYKLGPDNKTYHGADLVKVSVTHRDIAEGELLNLKIAHALFPEHFIHPTAGFWIARDLIIAHDPILAKTIYNDKQLRWVGDVISLLYSKYVHGLDPDHGRYSADMTYKKNNDGFYRKTATCMCEACLRHKAIHEDPTYRQQLNQTIQCLGAAGIQVPDAEDMSDHCSKADGKIVFFEVEKINYFRLLNYLESTPLSISLLQKGADFFALIEKLGDHNGQERSETPLLRMFENLFLDKPRDTTRLGRLLTASV